MRLLNFKLGKVAYTIDLAVYLILPVVAAVVMGYFSQKGNGLLILAAALSGFVGWTFLEYILHRFVLHHLAPFKTWHGEHHHHPTEAMGTPTLLSLLLMAGVIFLPSVYLFGWQIGGGFAMGLLFGYSIYTWVHHGEHHWHGKSTWFRQLKRAHAIHHHTRHDCNFGVVTSFWDRVFGTYAQK